MIIFILIECKLESSLCHSVCTLWSHMRNYTKSVAVSGPWTWPSLGFAGPVHPLLPSVSFLLAAHWQHSGSCHTVQFNVHEVLGPAFLPWLRSWRCIVYIYCTICTSSWNLQQQLQSATAAEISSSSCNLQQQLQSAAAAAICSSSCNLQQQLQSAAAAAICSSSWKCQKPAAKQLLGTAGGTVRYGRWYGLPITVKINTPLYSSYSWSRGGQGRAGVRVGSVLYGLWTRQKRRRWIDRRNEWGKKTFLAVKTFERI